MSIRYGDVSLGSATAAAPGARLIRPVDRARTVSKFPIVQLAGVDLHAVTEAEVIRHILDELDGGRGGVVVTPNLDHLRRCQTDIAFSALVTEADLVVADGMPLIWASRIQGTPLPERVAGSDLISSLTAAAVERNRSVFLLGGAPGTAEQAGEILRQRHPKLKLAGTCCPEFGFEQDGDQLSKLSAQLAASKADIVFVALGSPKQEFVIQQLKGVLPGAWWLGVGISFSFLCGDVQRAPLWMQRYGLEWIHRLAQEPGRLFKRYVVHGLPFAMRLMGGAAARGMVNRLRHPVVPAPVPEREAAESEALPAGGVERTSWPGNGSNGRRRHVEREELLDEPAVSPGVEPASDRLGRLRAVVLLSGSVRPTALTTSIGRSLLDLPVERDTTLLTRWMAESVELARWAGVESLPVRVLVGRNAHDPAGGGDAFRLLRVERDFGELRGTGGVLGDLAVEYADEDFVLVANGAQILLDPLRAIVGMLDRTAGDVSLVSHQDGTPSGIMLIRCGALRLIPKSGFVDMKEQALPAIASRFDVTVVHRRRPTGLPVRSLPEYVGALRHFHRLKSGRVASSDPLTEDWRPAFSIVESGAEASVDGSARIHDAVVLRGGRVEAGAVLVRSVVCPGGTLGRDASAVDQFVVKDDVRRGRVPKR